MSLIVDVFPVHTVTLLLVDEILLPTYVNLSTNFKGWSFTLKITLSCLKPMKFVFSEFESVSMPLAA